MDLFTCLLLFIVAAAFSAAGFLVGYRKRRIEYDERCIELAKKVKIYKDLSELRLRNNVSHINRKAR